MHFTLEPREENPPPLELFYPDSVAQMVDSNLTGGLITYDRTDLNPDETLGLISCGVDQSTLDEGDPYFYQFVLDLEGTANALSDVKIDGCYEFDGFLDFQLKAANLGIGPFFSNTQFFEPTDLVTLVSWADSLTCRRRSPARNRDPTPSRISSRSTRAPDRAFAAAAAWRRQTAAGPPAANPFH